MKAFTLLLAAALIAGLAWAQPFRQDVERTHEMQRDMLRTQAHLHVEDGECDGVMTQTRAGRGGGGMAMLQRQSMDGSGEHAKGPRGAGHKRGLR